MPPESSGESKGSTATTFTPGFLAFNTSPTPVIVPPVPMPATKISTLPSVSRQISSAVVLRCTAGFAGFLNCCGMNAFGSVASSSSALLTAPAMPSGPGVSTSSAPSAASMFLRSTLNESGIVSISR